MAQNNVAAPALALRPSAGVAGPCMVAGLSELHCRVVLESCQGADACLAVSQDTEWIPELHVGRNSRCRAQSSISTWSAAT